MQQIVTITKEEATQRVVITTNQPDLDALLRLVAEGMVWSLRSAVEKGEREREIEERMQHFNHRIFFGLENAKDKPVTEKSVNI